MEVIKWPDVDALEKTEKAIDLLESLTKSITNSYGGKIQAAFVPITYAFKMAETLSKITEHLPNKSVFCREFESKIEQGKTELELKDEEKHYKFMIYNGNFYYKILELKFNEFFPLKMKTDNGILPIKEGEFNEIKSFGDFRLYVKDILNSYKVKHAIMKLKD